MKTTRAPGHLTADLRRFIVFNTATGRPTHRFAREVGRMLRSGGFRVRYQKQSLGGQTHANVLGFKGPRGRPLLLCSHLDTVPPGNIGKWTRTAKNPWAARSRRGRIYGLGAADDKGPLLAMIRAGAAIDPRRLKRPVVIAATFGEESGMPGARLLTRRWTQPRPFGIIVGEPTELGITYRHKGIGVFILRIRSRHGLTAGTAAKSLDFHGRQAHSGRPWQGDNALLKALHRLRVLASRDHNLYLTQIRSGDGANVIPDLATLTLRKGLSRKKSGRGPAVFPAFIIASCVVSLDQALKHFRKRTDRSFHPPTLTSHPTVARIRKDTLEITCDFRLLPGQSLSKIYKEWVRRLRRILQNDSRLEFHVEVERNNPALGLRRDHPLIRRLSRLLRRSRLPVNLMTKPSCTEAGVYKAWGVPAVVIGPGRADGNIHAPNESIPLRQIEDAIQFYRSTIEAICGKKSHVRHS